MPRAPIPEHPERWRLCPRALSWLQFPQSSGRGTASLFFAKLPLLLEPPSPALSSNTPKAPVIGALEYRQFSERHVSMASDLHATTPEQSTSPFETALEEFMNELRKQGVSKRERDSFRIATLEELKMDLDKLQTEQHSNRKLRNMPRIWAFLEAMDQFGKVIELFCQVSGIVSSLWVCAHEKRASMRL